MALREVVEEDHDCNWLLQWVDGWAELDRRIFFLLLKSDEKKTVDEISKMVDRDRSTTYRAVRRLEEQGYLQHEQRTYENGGYCYQYETTNPEAIAADLEATIAACQQEMTALLEEFRDAYCESVEG